MYKRRCGAAHQVHPVPGARDETSVGQGVHRRELVKRHALVHVVDRHEFDGAESAVDPADEGMASWTRTTCGGGNGGNVASRSGRKRETVQVDRTRGRGSETEEGSDPTSARLKPRCTT
jgi:hypothetical protein